tara:strand:+ start:1576 stop:1983 length:408 start_codon:yes stop_codon:yes gene_type:complete
MSDTQNEPTVEEQIADLEAQRNNIGILLVNSAIGIENNGSRMRTLKVAIPILDDPEHQRVACDALQSTLHVNAGLDEDKQVAATTAAGAAKVARTNVNTRLAALKRAKKDADEAAAKEKAEAEKARKAASKARAA